MSWATAAAAIQIGSSVLGGIAGSSAQKKAKRAAKKQAELTYRTRMEELRRRADEQEGILGYNRAAIGASNILFSGSAQRAYEDTETQFARERFWMRDAAKLERAAIRDGAPGAAQAFANWAQTGASIGQALIDYKRGSS